MAYEDFTTFTKVDSASDFTVTKTKNAVLTMRRDAVSKLYLNYGSNHFGDLTHEIDVNWVAAVGDYGLCIYWAIANSGVTYKELSGGIGMGTFINGAPGIYCQIYLKDYTTSSQDIYGIGDTTNLPKQMYITITRSGTTLTEKIYSDSAKTSLLDTLVVTCNNTTYSTLTVTGSRDSSNYAASYDTCDIENLDIHEGTNSSLHLRLGVGGYGGVGGRLRRIAQRHHTHNRMS